MSGLRTGWALPGADSRAIVDAAHLAERWNIDTLWLGDPQARLANSDDSYVMVSAAAAAAVTSHVRIGVILSGQASACALRIAEDIGVVDQIAGGRLSVAFSPSVDPARTGDISRIAAAPRTWPLGDGRTMPVTPAPAQPTVPLLVLQPASSGLIGRSWNDPAGRPPVMAIPWAEGTAPPTPSRLAELRAMAGRSGADEVILLTPAPAPPLVPLATVIGTVIAPALRAADHEMALLALDATRWLQQSTNGVASPTEILCLSRVSRSEA